MTARPITDPMGARRMPGEVRLRSDLWTRLCAFRDQSNHDAYVACITAHYMMGRITHHGMEKRRAAARDKLENT